MNYWTMIKEFFKGNTKLLASFIARVVLKLGGWKAMAATFIFKKVLKGARNFAAHQWNKWKDRKATKQDDKNAVKYNEALKDGASLKNQQDSLLDLVNGKSN